MSIRRDKDGMSIALRRAALSLSQGALAAEVGISRQSLSAIEGGTVPSTTIALRLARALGCTVEDLFALEPGRRRLRVELAGARPGAARVAVANVSGRWVAHPLGDDPSIAADAIAPAAAHPKGARAASVEPVRDEALLRQNLLVLGCDPALGILASRLADRHARLRWLHAPSEAALEGLRLGHAHLAGIHLFDEETSLFNAPFVRRALPGASLLPLARWELGFVVARRNPLGIRDARDLSRRGLRLVDREPGAGSRKLLDRVLAKAGVRKPRRAGLVAAGHHAVAEAIALGAADVGVATRLAAESRGLHFLPLSEERFDLVLPRGALDDERIGWLVDALASRTFRRELSALRGYRTAQPEVTPA